MPASQRAGATKLARKVAASAASGRAGAARHARPARTIFLDDVYVCRVFMSLYLYQGPIMEDFMGTALVASYSCILSYREHG
jgi:hypothetical protein